MVVPTMKTEQEKPSVVHLGNEDGEIYYLPSGGKGEVVEHNGFTLSYVEKFEQAEWVAYELTKKQLLKPNFPRSKWFDEDKKVSTKSAKHSDYIRSGYSRGHLIPSADRSYDKALNKETFLMSNMSPQKAKFNGGVWNELENQVRNWAFDNKRLLVVTGPILDRSVSKYIGKNRVGVPKYFYKVLLDIDKPSQKGIGFILPNEKSVEPLSKYMVTIDEVEERTGLDFFGSFLDDSLEETLESSYNPKEWKIDEKLFNKRINQWNR